ncbi:MAG TPA: diguanylate cyclase [Myxococcota bacterium]|nr:diguanylate cyclase [Myxococcota bacterium]
MSTVLVVDDSEALRIATRRMLEQSSLSLKVIEAADGAEALPLALSGQVSIVVSDIVMPRLDGIQLLRGIRAHRDWDSLPVILVTSQAEEDTRNVSFEAGANDYLTRPFDSEELLGRIKVQLRLKSLHEELKRADERHRRLGTHDELTGLANRRHLLDLTRRELSRARRHKLAMSVCILELDDVRAVEQRVSHLAGDAIISDLATILTRNLRTADILARMGQHKFGVLLPHTDAAQGRAAGERLRSAVGSYTFPGSLRAELSVSVGVATYPTGALETVDELVNAAEASLDKARGKGGNRVEAWSPGEGEESWAKAARVSVSADDENSGEAAKG